jgi:hypothetical protein
VSPFARRRSLRAALAATASVLVVGTAACGGREGDADPPAKAPPLVPAARGGAGTPVARTPVATGTVPTYQVTTILVAYRSDRLPTAKRSREEARAFAESLARRVREGASMERLVRDHTDDRNEAGEPFNRGEYSLLAEGDTADPRLVALAARTPVGQVASDLYDSGTAFVVLRRDL